METVSLPVKKIILGAFLFPWRNREVFQRALALPAAALTLISILFWSYVFYLSLPLFQFPTEFPTTSFRYICFAFVLYLIFYPIFFILFATTVHRIVLLGHQSIPRHGLWKWTDREWRFLGWLIVVAVIAIIVQIVSSIVIGVPVAVIFVGPMAKASGIEGEISMPWLGYIIAMPTTYISARLSLVFPATAIDRRPNLSWAWDMTKNNGWRMFTVIGALPWLLSFIQPYLLSFLNLSSFLSIIPWEKLTVYEVMFMNLAGYALLAPLLMLIEITALSLSYKELIEGNREIEDMPHE